MAEFPDDVLIKLPDDFRNQDLIDVLERLWKTPEQRDCLGQLALKFVQERHDPAVCAGLYQSAIQQLQARHQQESEELLQQLFAHMPSHAWLKAGPLPFLEAAARQIHKAPNVWGQKQLLIDITETYHGDLRTGIERVARALTLAFLNSPPSGWRVEPVYLTNEEGGWHYRYAQNWTADLLGVHPPVPDARIDLLNPSMDYSSGDILIALDISGAAFIEAANSGLYQSLQMAEVSCHVLLHDVLPVTCPEYFPPQAPEQLFEPWLKSIVTLDSVICASRTVAGSLECWLSEQGLSQPAQGIKYSHHGADLASSAPTRGMPESAPALLEHLRKDPTLLMVGTLEPRKGYMQVLDAMNLLWEVGDRVNLVIVGQEGWRKLPDAFRRDLPLLMERLHNHPQLELGPRLFWLSDISDEYLEKLYASSSGLLAASWDEGFGLPLIEAAKQGLPILARDIPVFREVAGEHARYFKAEVPAQLAMAIRDWMQSGFVPPSANMPCLNWQESAGHLWHCIMPAEQGVLKIE